MPPTIQNGEDRDKRPVRGGDRRSEQLVCRVKYCNTLPDIPFDLKFITYPFSSTRFIQYNPTSLEKTYRYEVLTEHDLGVHIDLINQEIYQGDGSSHLDPADEKLLEEDILTPQDTKRSKYHAKSVSWLRRSEYISTEQTRFQPQSMEKVEAKVGYNVKKMFSQETLYMDRESQIKAIDKTFEDNKIPIEKHFSKPGVVPVEVMPMYPDFDLWKYPCAQVIFDSDPAPQDRNLQGQIEVMSQAMIRGVMDEQGEQFVAYFLPTEETLLSRRRDVTDGVPYLDGDTYEYKMAREYNWNVKSKASKGYEENYFLVMRDGQVLYNELETRVRLSKRRAHAAGATRLVVSHRPLRAREHRMLRLREKQVEPLQDEDEEDEDIEEEEEEEEEPEQSQEPTKENSPSRSKSRSKSKSKSPSGSKEGSRAGSEARSDRSRSRSKSRARSKSRSRSRAASRKISRSKSKSRSRSRSKSAASSRASSAAGSHKSRSRSRSGSAGSHSGSARSGSGSARSRSGSQRSRSGSARSRSGSARSRSGSARSRSGSARSRSGSARSRSGSRASSNASRASSKASSRASSNAASKAGSRASSKASSRAASRSSRSKSRSKSRSQSRANSKGSVSRSGSERSRSPSGSRSGSASGSDSD